MDLCQEIECFEKRLNCSLAFHDFYGELSGLAAPGRLALHHENRFCEKVRSADAATYAKCCSCDTEQIFQKIMEGRPFWKVCHAGFREAVFPILKNGHPSGVMFAGVFASAEETASVWTPPEVPDKEAEEDLLFWGGLFAEHIRFALEQLPEGAVLSGRDDRIRNWFNQNFRRQDCSLRDLAAALGLSESRTSHILKEELGGSFPELLSRYRLECAKQILQHSRLTIEATARMAGFRSANYLHRCFRKFFGFTPEEFRKTPQDRPDKQPPESCRRSILH